MSGEIIQNKASKQHLDAMYRVLLKSPKYKLTSASGQKRYFRGNGETAVVEFTDGDVSSVLITPDGARGGQARRYSLAGEMEANE